MAINSVKYKTGMTNLVINQVVILWPRYVVIIPISQISSKVTQKTHFIKVTPINPDEYIYHKLSKLSSKWE